MECPCGGETTVSNHTVTTTKKIQEWFHDDTVTFAGTLRVEQNTCRGCKRIRVYLFDAENDTILLTRG